MGIPLFKGLEVEKLRRAGLAAAGTLAFVSERLKAGMSTLDIDALVREDTARRGALPSQLGYHGFPATVCTSRNEVVCHGVPRAQDVLRDGDIINVDVTSNLDGYHGDCSETFLIGAVSDDARRLVDVARRCRDAGIAVVRHGAKLGDIGAAISELATREGCSVVAEFCGHGIGRQMHGAPQVPHIGRRGTGITLRSGMVLTIEPMVNLGRPEIRILEDGWTVVTRDGSLSAQFEHTLMVTPEGCEIFTPERLRAGP